MLALGRWVATGEAGFVLVATAAFLIELLSRPGSRRPLALLPALVGLGLVIAALAVEGRSRAIAERWTEIWSAREAVLTQRLDERLDRLTARGRAAAVTLASATADGAPPVEVLARLRRGSGFDAVAVYDSGGRLRVWDGVHRGRVPTRVVLGGTGIHYGEYALARYLYVTEATPEGSAVILARLLDSDFPPEVRHELGDLASEIERDYPGASLEVTEPRRADEGGGRRFAYPSDARALFSIRIEGVSVTDRLRRLAEGVRRAGSAAVILLWILLVVTPAGDSPRRGWAAASGIGMAFLLPLDGVPGVRALSAPADALLLGAPLGRYLLIVGALLVIAPVFIRRLRRRRWPRGAGVVVVAIGVPLVTLAASRSVAESFLASPLPAWTAFTLLLALAIGGIVRLGTVLEEDGRDARTGEGSFDHGVGGAWIAGAIALALFAGAATLLASGRPGVPVAATLAVAAAPLAWRRVADGSVRRETYAWILAIVTGSAVALPVAWGERIEARRAVAEDEVARLGVAEDPYLGFLLRGVAEIADSIDTRGARPVELLYQTWRNSGLDAARYPIHLTLWLPSGVAREDLRIGELSPERPTAAREAFERARGASFVRIDRMSRPDAHYVLTVPLREGRVLTGVVPPVRELGRATLLGPLFESLDRRPSSPLLLIPLDEGEVVEDAESDGLTWVRTGEGWAGEKTVAYPEGLHHAHYTVLLPPIPVTLARGMLLTMVHLAIGLLLVTAGVLLFGSARTELRGASGRITVHLGTFQLRITLALFAFFAASNLIFGALAHRTIEGASRRAAELLATRAAEEAGQVYDEVAGVVDFLARRVGNEVLEYRDAALREGSIEPLVELGLYEAWIPWAIHREIDRRERSTATQITKAGPWQYVTAYGRLPDGDIVGAPVPLGAGADAVRQAEVRDLLAFAMLLGAVLSFILALAAGRALASPIRALRVASERVGAGNLGVRLPEGRSDEFGALFDAFNRMVRRLRRARRHLVRTTRRTRAIVEESATGVIAVDADGIVSLVNERARDLLGVPVRERSAVGEAAMGEVGAWLDRYLREGPLEAATEIQVDERRIRVRVRRIAGEADAVGAVVNLEDVTDELRTERVLAWGEMARQVAHEVKNPLTPIRLSAQHVQRAWRDRREDFSEILERNVEAMLREIDRLAGIASSFSRLAAPIEAGAPLEAVELSPVIDEVLALYRTGRGRITFRSELPPDLPPVLARRSEVKEVIVNLLENARAATTERGTVRITATTDEGGLALAVRDEGMGIEESLLGRVFEPHFSTHSTGTGLGLAIVRRLVESWSGEVSLESRVGEGTAVTVRFTLHAGGEGGPPSGGSAS
ncbi:MAG: ATP-binding protein [Longimicrobiales bacterium]|nr:ATP-binding protein [Longimicrobiales bacterium]